MQTVKMIHSFLTGKGWVEQTVTFECDEMIGLRAGRDVYATARGTAIKIMRRYMLHDGTHCTLVIGDVHMDINVFNGEFQKSTPAPLGQHSPFAWEAK